ncbi:MAG: orotidine-5'-phosphate decarboxylase [Phycisphaeraceae bacterium]|nr:orotidine-5'-phosphate decarboxylase [Phycisphaeraceae bacterium]
MTAADTSRADHAANRLCRAIDRTGSAVCVGLDPVADRLPPELTGAPAARFEAFSRGVVDAVADRAAAVKFQSACYERLGAPGVAALHAAMTHARDAGLVVILDAKRGDIGISAQHYAAAAFEGPAPADWLTVSPYLGPDTIEPYLSHAGRGVFVLVRTSNAGSDAVQSVRLQDGRTVAELMADTVGALGVGRRGVAGLSSVGAVVGATKPADAQALRRRMPDTVLLVPGYGAQGGTADDIRALVRPGAASASGKGVLVTASRSIIYAAREAGQRWQDAVRRAAESMRDELGAVL